MSAARKAALPLAVLLLVPIAFLAARVGSPARDGSAGGPSIVVDDTQPIGPVNRTLVGADFAAFFRNQTMDPAAQALLPSALPLAQSIGLNFIRMSPAVNLQHCGGTDCTYHWWAATPGTSHSSSNFESYALSPDQWMRDAQSFAGPDAVVMPLFNVEAGTLSEAQDWVAYMNGSTTSDVLLSDGTTVGSWARIRAANGSPAPYGVHYWEVGNEEHGLKVCLTQPNQSGCVNNPPPTCVAFSGDNLYGCLVATYGFAAHLVDPSIVIVANGYNSATYSDVYTAAGAEIGAIDAHQYGALVDPYGTTFDTDGQSATYTVTDVTNLPVQTVTFALWIGTTTAAHVDAYLDGSLLPTNSFSVTAGLSTEPFVLHTVEAGAGEHAHSIRVVACQSSGTIGVCRASGGHPGLDLAHITATLGNVSSSTLSGAVKCMQGVDELQSLNNRNTPTVLEDTRVTTTQGRTGNATDPGVPWRLSADSDFPITFSAGQTSIFGNAALVADKLTYWRRAFANAGFTHTPLIIGEYAAYGGCDGEPPDLTLTQSAAIWDALITQYIAEDRNTAQPIIAAAVYAFHDGGPGPCSSFSMLSSPLVNRNPCQGSDAAYLQPVGLAMSQFASYTGTALPVHVAGVSSLSTYPNSSYPASTAAAVTGIASVDGGTVNVVLVNACPPGSDVTPSQCASPAMPITVSLGSARNFAGAYATTVSGPPYADNTDAAPTTVSKSALDVTLDGASVELTLPPFSVTSLTLTPYGPDGTTTTTDATTTTSTLDTTTTTSEPDTTTTTLPVPTTVEPPPPPFDLAHGLVIGIELRL